MLPQHRLLGPLGTAFPILLMAASMVFINCASLNGLVRKSAIPSFMARTEEGMSPWAVMKMMADERRRPCAPEDPVR